MTLRSEPFHLRAWVVKSSGGELHLPLLAPLAASPEAAAVVLAFEELDHFRLHFESTDRAAVLELEGLEGEVRAGRTVEVTSAGGEGEYAWYPGTYALTVRARGQQWHGLIAVRPRHLPLGDLERMRHDLEQLVAGLSLDVVAGRGYTGRHRARPRAGAVALRMNQLLLLHQALRQVEPALRDIALAPQRRLDRQHAVVPRPQARRLDAKSFRWLARGEWRRDRAAAAGGWESTATLLAPRPAPSYDTYENRVIAFILERFAERAEQLRAALERDLALARQEVRQAQAMHWQTQVLEEREASYQRLLPAVAAAALLFGRLRRQAWLGAVAPLTQLPRPTVILRKDPRYRILYRWYRRLAGALVRVDTGDAAFIMRAKRTSTLYEYWCVFRLLDLLGGLGLRLEGGWLSEQLRGLNRDRLVPILPAGAEFWLGDGAGRRLRLVYDRELQPTVSLAAAQGHEFYIASPRNRPDLRLDLYLHGSYQRSLVFDAKYSRPSSIWDENRYGERMAQLQAYVYNLFAVAAPGRQTVRAVVALYPGRSGESEWQEREDGRIALARLAPGVENEALLRCLRAFVTP